MLWRLFLSFFSARVFLVVSSYGFFALFLFCVILGAGSSFFFSGEKERTKEKRHFWQTAPQPKEALLRVMVARVILFVCAGATAPHVLAPLFVFFLGAGILGCFFALFLFLFSQCGYLHCLCFTFFPVSPYCFSALSLASYYPSILSSCFRQF